MQEKNIPIVAITGAAGNLGSLLANSLVEKGIPLHLLIHKKDISDNLKNTDGVKVFRTDLEKEDSLQEALTGIDVIVHFAGVLFKANPEKFLPKTNTIYFRNLLNVAIEKKVKRVILISFPHVEGESTPENPATGHLNGSPESMHARTRLEEEKLLFEYSKKRLV